MRQFLENGAAVSYNSIKNHKEAYLLGFFCVFYVLGSYSWIIKPEVPEDESDFFGMSLQILTAAVFGTAMGTIYKNLPKPSSDSEATDVSCAFIKNHKEAFLLSFTGLFYVLGGHSWFFKPSIPVHATDVIGMLMQAIAVTVVSAAVGAIYKNASLFKSNPENSNLLDDEFVQMDYGATK